MHVEFNYYYNCTDSYLRQNLLYLCAFVYTALMIICCRSKHTGGTYVTNYYLLLIFNLLFLILYKQMVP
jgi:hypothetical protein